MVLFLVQMIKFHFCTIFHLPSMFLFFYERFVKIDTTVWNITQPISEKNCEKRVNVGISFAKSHIVKCFNYLSKWRFTRKKDRVTFCEAFFISTAVCFYFFVEDFRRIASGLFLFFFFFFWTFSSHFYLLTFMLRWLMEMEWSGLE